MLNQASTAIRTKMPIVPKAIGSVPARPSSSLVRSLSPMPKNTSEKEAMPRAKARSPKLASAEMINAMQMAASKPIRILKMSVKVVSRRKKFVGILVTA